jgi:hypothetical protein
MPPGGSFLPVMYSVKSASESPATESSSSLLSSAPVGSTKYYTNFPLKQGNATMQQCNNLNKHHTSCVKTCKTGNTTNNSHNSQPCSHQTLTIKTNT